MKPVRLVIADDTKLIRRAVQHVVIDCCPGAKVVGEARNYAELFQLKNNTISDVVLIDLNMPGEFEPDHVRVELDSCCILVMSAWFDESTKARAQGWGAFELLDKSSLAGNLHSAIERGLSRSKSATH